MQAVLVLASRVLPRPCPHQDVDAHLESPAQPCWWDGLPLQGGCSVPCAVHGVGADAAVPSQLLPGWLHDH